MNPPNILIACIGNIFLGDDAFGVEVARALSTRSLPTNVKLVDFGIRGWDLTYALMEDRDAVILVDAVPRGQSPGTLYLIEPDANEAEDGAEISPQDIQLDTHNLDPAKVLRLASSLVRKQNRILLVGCEPMPMDVDQDMAMELSEPVRAAIPEAVKMIESLLNEINSTEHLAERS
jgi:hydrogenase maturation protease